MEKEKPKTAKIDDVERVTVSSGVMEGLLGVTDSRVRQLAREGVLTRASKGRYLLYESVRNYIKTLKIQSDMKNGGNGEGEIDYEEEHAKLERAKRQQAELKLALMKGELHKGTDVELVMNDMLASVRGKLLNLPSKISPRVAMKSDTGTIQRILTEEIHEALYELKNYDPKDFYSEEFVEVDHAVEEAIFGEGEEVLDDTGENRPIGKET